VSVVSEPTQEVPPGRGLFSRTATTATLLFAAGALLSLVAKLLFENRRNSLACGDSRTQILDGLLLAAIVCSILAVVLGIAALATHSQHTGWVALGMLVASTTVALILVPEALGGYQCGIGAA
jgi:hypothetical protein